MPIFVLVPIALLNYFIHKNLNWACPLGKEQMTTIFILMTKATVIYWIMLKAYTTESG